MSIEEKQMEILVEDAGLVIGKTRILDQINMKMERGKIYGFVGRNGSGKTMIMKCICGFVKLTEGQITVSGQIVGKDIDFPTSMGMIIENPGFIPYYSGMKNLSILAKVRRQVGKQEIATAMKQVGLDPQLKLPVGKYSLGMRQRLGIAQAIMENPRLLILDEPMNGLDTQGVEDVRALLLQLREQGKTIVIASHNKEDIAILCDRVWSLEHGRIVCCE
jgi:ABC-2 type transport system ATP-binding protein